MPPRGIYNAAMPIADADTVNVDLPPLTAVESFYPVSYTHLTLPTTPYV